MEQILQHIYHPEVRLSKVDTLQYFITKWVQYILLMLHFDRRFVGNFIPLLLWSPETIQFWYYKFGYFKFYITQAAYFKVELDLHFHKFYIFSCCHSFWNLNFWYQHPFIFFHTSIWTPTTLSNSAISSFFSMQTCWVGVESFERMTFWLFCMLYSFLKIHQLIYPFIFIYVCVYICMYAGSYVGAK